MKVFVVTTRRPEAAPRIVGVFECKDDAHVWIGEHINDYDIVATSLTPGSIGLPDDPRKLAAMANYTQIYVDAANAYHQALAEDTNIPDHAMRLREALATRTLWEKRQAAVVTAIIRHERPFIWVPGN